MAEVTRSKRIVAALLVGASKKALSTQSSLRDLQKALSLSMVEVQDLEGFLPIAEAALEKVRVELPELHDLLDVSPEEALMDKYVLEFSDLEDILDETKKFIIGTKTRIEEEDRRRRKNQ